MLSSIRSRVSMHVRRSLSVVVVVDVVVDCCDDEVVVVVVEEREGSWLWRALPSRIRDGAYGEDIIVSLPQWRVRHLLPLPMMPSPQ